MSTDASTNASTDLSSSRTQQVDPIVWDELPDEIRMELAQLSIELETSVPEANGSVQTSPVSNNGEWSCRTCTFLNHPDVQACEVCETIRVPRPIDTSPSNISETRSPRERVASFGSELYKKITSPFSKSKRRAHLPSSAALPYLYALQQHLNTKCTKQDAVIQSYLHRLWVASGLPRDQFSKEDDRWMQLGFQSADPIADFRGGGLLSLECLVHLFEKEDQLVLHEKERWYPVSVAGINLACLMADVMGIGDGQFESMETTYWGLLEEEDAFHRLFCVMFDKMDRVWHQMTVSHMEFGVVLTATRKILTTFLNNGPKSIDELERMSSDVDVTSFVPTSPRKKGRSRVDSAESDLESCIRSVRMHRASSS